MSGQPFSEREEEANRLLRALSEHERTAPAAEPVPELPRYEILAPLGEGATALVYRAFDSELKRTVALKVLRPRALLSDIARQRFRREAETAAGLSHPNLVAVYDVGEAEGRPYLVMELVEGRPLNVILAAGEVSEQECARLVEEAARGVAVAHAHGIIHRDLKPGNILVTPDGQPKVGDFGLAHLMDSSVELTRTGSTLGTPLYMAPEQVEGHSKELTPKTDVYALGAVLYEGLVGRPPHPGESLLEVYQAVVHREPAAPRSIKPSLAPDLETIVLKAMEKDPARRYATALEFAEDLRRYRSGEPILARPAGAFGRAWRWVRGRRAVLLPLAMGILAGLGAGFWAAKRGRTETVAVIERIDGTVYLVGTSGRSLARPGRDISLGEGLETGDAPSHALITFRDGTRLELGPGTSIQKLAGEVTRKSTKETHGKHVVLKAGTLRAEIPQQPDQLPVTFQTSHGEARSPGGAVRLVADPQWVRLEILVGSARFTRTSDRRTLDLPAGSFAVAASETPFAALPLVSEGVIRVGKGKDFARPSQAAAAARDGATVEIDAGPYPEDAAVWTANNLSIRAVGGRAKLEARGAHVEGKGIWVIRGNDVTVEDVEFSGAAVRDQNGSGIRTEGRGLTIRRCLFRNNQNGVLGGTRESDLVIEHSEFAGSGVENGLSHNISITSARTLTVQFCYVHHARGGHQIKSHARTNHILYNRVSDDEGGTSSYLACLGGRVFIIGNQFQKASGSVNPDLLSFAVEQSQHPVQELYVVNNTFFNEHPSGIFIRSAPEVGTVRVLNNIFIGPGTSLKEKGEASHNLAVRYSRAILENQFRFDCHLRKGAPAIDGGVAPGAVPDFDLTPRFHYVHPAGKEPRPVVGALDIGALEYAMP